MSDTVREGTLLAVANAIQSAIPIIKRIQEKRGSVFVSFICEQAIDYTVAYNVNKLLRKIGPGEKLDIMIESSGGYLDSTVKTGKILKKYFKQVGAIVPFYAKSAATYLVLSADEILMCKASELGPLDPQVRETISKTWIPAHSIRKALGFIESTEDELVKLQLADKIPPLLVGAYIESEDSSRQYLEELFEGHENRDKIVDFFTQKFLSHGYPIDDTQCKQLGLNVIKVEDDLEGDIYDLYELYEDLEQRFSRDDTEGLLIIQTENKFVVLLDDEDVTEQIKSTLQVTNLDNSKAEKTGKK
jgi:hypothetical protein